MVLRVSSELLHVDRDGVQEVARVDHHTVVALQTDLGLKLGIRSHQIKLGVDGHPMLQTRQPHTGVPRIGHLSDTRILIG